MFGKTDQDYGITPETIAAAEKLFGLEFTEAERQQMIGHCNTRRGWYEKLHALRLANDVPPAYTFDPRLPEMKPRTPPTNRAIRTSAVGPVDRPANLEDAAFYPVTHLAELVRTRQVKSVELTEMYLERLKHYDRWLECVTSFTEDLALRQARRADEEIAAGHYRGPLHGIPWGAKDLLATKGYKTTWGAMPYKDQMIDLDATVVQRLEEAGAVLIAKLTLGALAYGDIWYGGTTKNPWDISEGSSGSSAGPGSATAAGLVGFSIGTETLGSIVSPSTRCGVSGLRPTTGRVSRYGAMALSWTLDKIGPMCRSVEDCALVFNAIYGTDGLDGHLIDMPFEWNPDLNVTKLRVGYLKSAFDEERDNKANDDAVLETLRGLSIDLIPVELPDIDHNPLMIVLLAEGAAAFQEMILSNQDDLMVWQDEQAWPNTMRQAMLIPAVEYVQANRVRTQLMAQMNALMQQVDVFVGPSLNSRSLFFTNFTGHPTVVVPNGYTAKGTTTSIAFTGGLFREAETLALAKAYQDATIFHQQYPAMQYEGQ